MPVQRVGDLNVYYEIAGDGEPLLLIHGLGSCTEDWEAQVSELARSFRVITYDVRGHGRTGKPPGPYSVVQFAADSAGLLEALGIGPVHVVGLSMGGMIAFQMMADYPDIVRSAIIANSGPALVPQNNAQRRMLSQRKLLVRLLGMRRWGAILAKRLFPLPGHAALRNTFTLRMSRNNKRAYLDTQNALIGWSVLDRIAAMHHPTLVIAADQDYTPVAVKEAYAAKMSNARVIVIPNARHAVPMERPEEFNRIVLDFLTAQPSTA
ncbi:MAG: alpha/beta fold hydrolase [Gemmatimonadaceae bacterium]|nr:alpha/beta fold hydrolase [Gemmatimonadaceae bacterium]